MLGRIPVWCCGVVDTDEDCSIYLDHIGTIYQTCTSTVLLLTMIIVMPSQG